VFVPSLDPLTREMFHVLEQRLVFLAALEENSTAESTAAASPQQAEPQAAPQRQPSPG